MDSLLALSNVTQELAARRERYAVAWENLSTGTIRFEINPREGSRCGIDVVVPPDTPQERVAGIVHTHPHHRNEDMTACDAAAKRYRPDANGGGSTFDWTLARRYGVDVYSVSPEAVYRLVSSTPERDRNRNPNRWKRKSGQCPTRN